MSRDLHNAFRYQKGPFAGSRIEAGDVIRTSGYVPSDVYVVLEILPTMVWMLRLSDGKRFGCGYVGLFRFVRSGGYHCRLCGDERAPLDDGTKDGADPGLIICEMCDEDFDKDGTPKDGTPAGDSCVQCGHDIYNYHCPACGEFGGWGFKEWCTECGAVIMERRYKEGLCSKCGWRYSELEREKKEKATRSDLTDRADLGAEKRTT